MSLIHDPVSEKKEMIYDILSTMCYNLNTKIMIAARVFNKSVT